MEKELEQKNRRGILAAVAVVADIITIGAAIGDMFNSQRVKDEEERKYREQLKWQETITSKLNAIQSSLTQIGDSLLELSNVIVENKNEIIENVKKEFESYVINCLIATIRTIAAQYSDWKKVLEGNDNVKKLLVIDTIKNKKQELFQRSVLVFKYSYSCCDSMAMALTSIISLCELIDDKTGLNGICDEFAKYFNECLDTNNPKSIPSELKLLKHGSNYTEDVYWHEMALIQSKTNIEKYLITIENVKNPGIQVSINYGFVRIGDYNDPRFMSIKWNRGHESQIGSKVDINVLGNNFGGEVLVCQTKVIRIVAIDPADSNSIFFHKTLCEDLGWEELCNNMLARVEDIDFQGKLVLVSISGAHAYQYPTPEFAAWLRKIGATLKDWKISTDASGPSDACCYLYLGKCEETPIHITEKFAINWTEGHYYWYADFESYMLRLNYNYPLA